MEIKSTAACYVLHYGAEWLRWSLRSVCKSVDNIYVFYTERPSFGHQTMLHKPIGESRDELMEICGAFDNVVWKDADRYYDWEGQHRDAAMKYITEQGHDVIFVVDADEIWPKLLMDYIIMKLIMADPKDISRVYRIGMQHFWRSLKWVCRDAACPTRVFTKNGLMTAEQYFSNNVFHMGYAQSPDLIRYKESIHGHKSEWRPNWFDTRFMNWEPGNIDVHPTCVNFWSPELYYDDGQLQAVVGDHPYWNLDIIR